MAKKSIVWLASYPKSGNTWLRLFLFNYLFDGDQPAPINQAHRVGPSDATAALYRKIAPGPVDLTDPATALSLRDKVIAGHASNGADVNFMKTHSIRGERFGTRLIPDAVTRAALYIIRDPLDLVVSFAHHYGLTHEQTVAAIGNSDHAIGGDDSVVPQFLGTWSEHVTSWARGATVLRYEDMTAAPHETFATVLKTIGAPVDEARLDKAIRFSSFQEAKKQETKHGFVERSKTSAQFFRSGKVGEGREALTPELIDRIVADHGDVMKAYGYLA